MYCPVCGKQQVNDMTRFCSGCGFPLTGVSEVIAVGGASPRLVAQAGTGEKAESPRRVGIKQGAWIMLFGCFLVVPLVAILSSFLRPLGMVVPIVAVLSFMGGLMRIIYALMFESATAPVGLNSVDQMPGQLSGVESRGALPPQTSIPVDFRMPQSGNWRDTSDLTPSSVTESTTRLLDKEGNQ